MHTTSDITPLSPERSLTHLLEECRMVLPGIQALFGFQLVAIFEPPFFKILSPAEQIAHFVALATMAIAIGLVLAPAAYHRIAEPEIVSQSFLRLAARLLSTGMAFLLIGMEIDIYLIGHAIFKSAVGALIPTAIVGALLITLWFIIPLRRARSIRQ